MGTAAAGNGQERPGDGASPGARPADQITPELPEEQSSRTGPPAGSGSVEPAASELSGPRSALRGEPRSRRVVPRDSRRPRPVPPAIRAPAGPGRAPTVGGVRCPRQAPQALPTSRPCPRQSTCPRWSMRSSGAGGTARCSTAPWTGPPPARSGPSTRGRRPPTACPACITSRPGSSRTSSPGSRPCRGFTCPARPAGTATACRWRSRSRRNSGCRGRRTSRRSGSPRSTSAVGSRCCCTWMRSRNSPPGLGTGSTCPARTARWTPVTSSPSGGRSRRSSATACWSRTTGSARTARAARRRCRTTRWASRTSTGR